MPISINKMACHTWALSGNPANGVDVHNRYEALTNQIGFRYDFGGNLRGQTMAEIRQETMNQIAELCDVRTHLTGHRVYLCGGFREGQVCPEHMWLEDFTSRISYDTFIDLDVQSVHRVGTLGQPFQPGCEADAFEGDEIARVRVDGYTAGQHGSLP